MRSSRTTTNDMIMQSACREEEEEGTYNRRTVDVVVHFKSKESLNRPQPLLRRSNSSLHSKNVYFAVVVGKRVLSSFTNQSLRSFHFARKQLQITCLKVVKLEIES